MAPSPIIIILILLIVGGAAAYYFLVMKKTVETPPVSSGTDSGSSSSDPESSSSGSSTSNVESSSSGSSTSNVETSNSQSSSSGSGPETEPEPASPDVLRAILVGTGQAIQVEEINLKTTSPLPTFVTPIITDPSKVKYTMSMDIKIISAPPSGYPIIFANDNSKVYGWPTSTTYRRPALLIVGSADKKNKIGVIHATKKDTNDGVTTTFKSKEGVYFNLTWVVNNKTMTVYINGVEDGKITDRAFTWSTNPNPSLWSWLPDKQTGINVSLKNVYWFDKALTKDEVKLFGTPQTSGTSGYALPPKRIESEPEPYSLGY